jgi:hypothetical protein
MEHTRIGIKRFVGIRIIENVKFPPRANSLARLVWITPRRPCRVHEAGDLQPVYAQTG